MILVFEILQYTNLFCELPVLLWYFTTYGHHAALGQSVTKTTKDWLHRFLLSNELRVTWSEYLTSSDLCIQYGML